MATILDSLASYVQNMLTEMAAEEVHILIGVTDEIAKMGKTLGDLKHFLADADRRNIIDLSVRAWVKELRDAMYCATDILDLCQLKAMEQGPSQDIGCFNPLLFCMRNPLHAHDIGRRIKKLNETLDGIKSRIESFNFINLGSYEDHGRNIVSPSLSSRETSWGIDESGLVGEKIEEDTRNLVDMLTHEYETHQGCRKIMVFAIIGVGGIGKTTLAQKIFNNDIIQQEFTKKIWLSINQDFNEKEILRTSISEAGGDHAVENTRVALENALKNALNGHKTLLIMDDVWDCHAWEDVLKTSFITASISHGSRVLITTRKDTVARGMFAEQPYHRISKLELEDAWLLLKEVVGNLNNNEQKVDALRDIGMQIIAKCDGLPLAVKVMGGLLRQKNTRRSDWENVLKDSVWSISQMPDEINYAIYLSYKDLHTNLKPCFLHYALLPKSIELWDDTVVSMWISEGFVQGNSCDLEVLGKDYYNQLIGRNLIEPDQRIADQKVCNMHDVVRSFAQYVARDEALIARKTEAILDNKLNSQNVIRLSLETKESEANDLGWSSIQAHKSLRTLILFGQIKINPDDSLLSFSCLRVLHIEYGNFDVFSGSLVQLKHLRYFSVRCTDTSRLPEKIGKMKFLQHINLGCCGQLVKLPGDIGELQQLRFLGINDTGINKIPLGFDGLTNLRKLYGFPVYMEDGWCSLEELGPLNQLIRLRICGLENVSSSSFAAKAKFSEKVRLSYLGFKCSSRCGDDHQLVTEEEQKQIEKVFDELCPPPCLEHLAIEGYFGQRLPTWMMSIAVAPLENVRIICLEDLPYCTDLPCGLSQLPFLEMLQINRAPAIQRVGHEFICSSRSKVMPLFSSLVKLFFSGMEEWEEWEWEKHVEAMRVLELLQLERCKLRRVPSGLAMHARALKTLWIYNVKNLKSLENFPSLVHLDVFRNCDLESISNLPKLQKLVIVMCPKMKVLDGMPALRTLELEDYGMEIVPRYLQDVRPRNLLLDCSLSLLTCIAAGKSSPEWYKFSHIQQVKGYADDEGSQRKRYVLYTKDPFRFETNISRYAIGEACWGRTVLAYLTTCPDVDGRQPLCLLFRWQAYRQLVPWLHGACLHCSKATHFASSSDQWSDPPACTRVIRVRITTQ